MFLGAQAPDGVNFGLVMIYAVWGYIPFPTTELLLLSVPDDKLNTWVLVFCCGFFLWRQQKSSCKTCTATG